MKPPLALMSAILVLVATASGAAKTDIGAPPPLENQALSPAETWIRDLADDRFETRENATRQLWDLGKPILPLLEESACSPDPERSIRAALIRERIHMGVTPKTDPEILTWIEQFPGASSQHKQALMGKLRGKLAWKPMLKLFAAETDPDLMEKLLPSLNGVPLRAAREALLANQPENARELLELAPNQWENLLALAEFHRTQGSLQQEIERAQSLQGQKAATWRVALALSADRLPDVRAQADAAGMPRIGALAAAFEGDPLPWFRTARLSENSTAVNEAYHSAAAKRWKSATDPSDEALRPLLRIVQRPGSNDPTEALSAAFLIGQNAAAERALIQESPILGFKYFDMLERVPEAYAAIKLDANQPIRADWVAEKLKEASNPDVEDQHAVNTSENELLALANVLERRGLHDDAWNAFNPPLQALSATKENAFIDFLDRLFGGRTGLDGAPSLALRIGAAWAGNDANRWNEVATAALGDDDDSRFWWRLSAEIAPNESPQQRVDALLALHQLGSDPKQLRPQWVRRILNHFSKLPDAQRIAGLLRLRTVIATSGDTRTLLEIQRNIPSSVNQPLAWNVRMIHLSAMARWDEVANLLLEVIDSGSNQGIYSRADLHAYAAASLRRAGRETEACKHDSLAEKLSLGDAATAQRIGYAYFFGLDFPRAASWWRRAILFSNDDSYDYAAPLESNPLRSYCEFLLEQHRWTELAALSEVQASCAILGNSYDNPLDLTRVRLIADLARAMSLPPAQHDDALRILNRCHRDHLKDGTLADFFFPSVQKAFPKEHNTWFEETWQAMHEVIQRYPNSDNSLNTTAWFASRACLRLPEARKLVNRSLELRPLQAAYLDTYAEVEFAAGDRTKALKWSDEAVNQRPNDTQLRRQQHRFQLEPLRKSSPE